jgi:nitrogen fixation NifU-like protein
MQYSKKVIKHFQKPHNQGAIKNADAVGEAGNPVCGDVMKIYLKIKKSPLDKGPACPVGRGKGGYIIKDIKFETLGCAAAIAVSSSLTDIVKGMTLDKALELKKDKIVKELGGLPPAKIHCSMLGLEALHKAIKKYKSS